VFVALRQRAEHVDVHDPVRQLKARRKIIFITTPTRTGTPKPLPQRPSNWGKLFYGKAKSYLRFVAGKTPESKWHHKNYLI
jgi:hypothetical protein